MRKVEVLSFTKQWSEQFEAEAKLLQQIFRDEIIQIHHIGSTSVEGLSAKPIIDIMPVVKNISRVDQYNEAMRKIGYETKGENGLQGRRYFQKGGNQRTHHVHIYEQNHPDIARHLAFRDYLKAHPNIAKEYGNLKEELAKRYPFNIESYINGKEKLVLDIERKAVEWYNKERI